MIRTYLYFRGVRFKFPVACQFVVVFCEKKEYVINNKVYRKKRHAFYEKKRITHDNVYKKELY